MAWLIDNNILLLVVLLAILGTTSRAELSCSLTSNGDDPALKEMRYDVGNGEERVDVYVEPTVEEMYKRNPPARNLVVPKYGGFSTKFINMSKKRVELYWYVSAFQFDIQAVLRQWTSRFVCMPVSCICANFTEIRFPLLIN